MDLLYTAEATARGGREGEVVSDDGALDLMLAYPKELGGPGGDTTNPEQLLAIGQRFVGGLGSHDENVPKPSSSRQETRHDAIDRFSM